MKNFGKELILDLHDCDVSLFNREDIKQYFEELAELTNMELQALHWWDDTEGWKTPLDLDSAPDHFPGVTAIQFISTSNFTIHALSRLRRVYLNIFTCKDFDPQKAEDFTVGFFKGRVVSSHVIDRV